MAEAQQRCTIKEFRLWQAYALLEPFGAFRDDARMAIQTAYIVSAVTGRSMKPLDFMPKFGRQRKPKQQTPDEMVDVLCHAFGVQRPPETE